MASQAPQDERAVLELGRAHLSADQAELMNREEQLAATNAAIEKALAETRDASEALRGELALVQGELVKLRSRYDTDVDKLRDSLASERCANESTQAENERTLRTREDRWREECERLEAREAAHERRFLTEVDQARQGAKLLESELAKERKCRLQVEEEGAVDRKTHWAALEEAKRSERKLREELQSQAIALTQTRAREHGLGEQIESMRRQLAAEAATHAQARAALAQAIAAVAQRTSKRRGQGRAPKK
ncbi:hypothetical protein QTI66_29455 [Variovorax sp. J22R133]|uniref:hypothetical protein n=1 Tax=Variovorax brevis TaxID=3053503 RepID=UPI0025762350|nr:hypothetical protein [Variovorax sp. J22R133]MDM0116289.1 hypothetical protein [Variovorax sp. J22R133]